MATAPLRGKLGRITASVTYQDPCHLAHAQRIASAPRQILRAIPGLRLVEMEEASLCCGSAGIYSITQPEMSLRLRSRKLQHVRETKAQIIVSANPGCMLHLQAGLRGQRGVSVRHLVELLDESYQRGATGPSSSR